MAKVRICLWVITLDIKQNARSDWSLDTEFIRYCYRAYSIMLRAYSWYHTVAAINVNTEILTGPP